MAEKNRLVYNSRVPESLISMRTLSEWGSEVALVVLYYGYLRSILGFYPSWGYMDMDQCM